VAGRIASLNVSPEKKAFRCPGRQAAGEHARPQCNSSARENLAVIAPGANAVADATQATSAAILSILLMKGGREIGSHAHKGGTKLLGREKTI